MSNVFFEFEPGEYPTACSGYIVVNATDHTGEWRIEFSHGILFDNDIPDDFPAKYIDELKEFAENIDMECCGGCE